MSFNIKALILGVAIVAPLTLAATPVLASTAGQIEGGDIYRVRNVTKGGDFADPTNADKCETVQFKVRIHNPGPDALTGVKVGATLPSGASTSHSSKVTVTADNANPKTTTDTAGVKLSGSYKISYVGGSTQLLDANNSVMQTLPDGIVGGQVNIPGGVGVSTQQKRFVQFSAKVDCPEVPPVVSTGECKAVSIKLGDNRKVTVTITSAVNNATIIGYKTDFGDGTVTNGQTASHTYAKDGTYKIVSSVNVKYADGKTEWKTADGCTKNVTFSPKEEPKVTPVTPSVPTTPTELPKTGAGSIAAVFGSVVALSAIAYSVISRRFGSQS